MSIKSRVFGAAIGAYLDWGESRPRRKLAALGRIARGGKRRLFYYHRADDPEAHLMVQGLRALAERYPLEVRTTVVPAPAADVDPEPELRASYDLHDARLTADHHGLSFPPEAELPSEARLRLANAILLVDRPPEAQLELAEAAGTALFAGDGDALSKLAGAHGALSGQDVTPALEAHYGRLRKHGHYRGAALFYEGEWYVGVDRLYHLEVRLREEGIGDGPLRFGRDTVEVEELEVPPPPQAGPPKVELFFSFRSPYSYIGLVRLRRLAEKVPMEIVPRPVLPMVMRGLQVPTEKRFYIVKDAAREAERHGVPFGKLVDPLGPGIERCLAVFAAVEEQGKGLDFMASVARGVWSEAADIDTVKGLLPLAERAGIEAAAVEAALEGDTFRVLAEENRRALIERGMWGVPSFVSGTFHAWGQDRIPSLAGHLGARIRPGR